MSTPSASGSPPPPPPPPPPPSGLDDSALVRLWEKTIPGGDLHALPVNVTYRPPERADAVAAAARPVPPPDSAGAATIASGPRLPSVIESGIAFDSDGAWPLPDARQDAPRAPQHDTGAATIASGTGLPKLAPEASQGPPRPVSDTGAATIASGAALPRPGAEPTPPPAPSAAEVSAAATIASTGGHSRTPTLAAPEGPTGAKEAGSPRGPGAPGGAPPADTRADGRLSTTTSFEIVNELGRGGMGIVYRARQRSLDREVALKRLIPEKAGPEERAQFLAEALVTGVLDHPNIVSVHDLGRTAGGDIFLAMKLVKGRSWHDLLHPREEADRARAAKLDTAGHIRLLLEVANAVAFAHSKGIVHRDLKPANVMVGEYGEVLVMDWGIAVAVGDRTRPEATRVPHRTSVTTPAGTPCYMPPELAAGRGVEIGPATDVFLLGAILHEIVTGAPPHTGTTLIEVLKQALRCEPREYGPEVPAALAAILRRAMAKEPAKRYASVEALRTALEDYLAHRESIRISDAAGSTLRTCLAVEPRGDRAGAGAAGPPGDMHPEVRRARNRRYAAFAEAVAGFHQALLLWAENDAAKAGERRARVAFAEAALVAGDLGLAEAQASSLAEGDEERARIQSDIARASEARLHKERSAQRLRQGLRAAVIVIVLGLVAVIAIVRGEQQRVARERDRAKQAEQSASLERDRAKAAEATASRERDRARLEAWNGRVEMARGFVERAVGLAGIKRFQSAEACLLRALEVAPRADVPSLLTPTWDAPAWPAEAWRLHRAYFASCPRESHVLAAMPGVTFTASAVGPSGTCVLLGDERGRVHVFDLATGTQTALIASSVDEPVTGLSLSPDQRTATAVSSFGALRILDLERGVETRRLGGSEWGFTCAALDAEGRRLFAGGVDRKVWCFDPATGHALWNVDTDDGGPPRTPASLCVSPDGKLGLVGLWDGSARLFETGTGKQLAAYWGALHWVSAVAFDRDARTAWLGSDDGMLRRIDIASGKEVRRLSTDDVARIRISADARSALVRLRSGAVEIFALDRAEKSSELEAAGARAISVAPSADANTAVVVFEKGPPRLFDLSRALRRPRRLEDLGPKEDPIDALAITLDRRRFLVATRAGKVALLEVRRRKEVKRFATEALRPSDAALSADGTRALVGTVDGRAHVLDLEAGTELLRVDPSLGPARTVEWRDDGKLALLGAERGALLFDPADGREIARIPAPPEGISRARLAPDGRALVAASGTRILVYGLDPSGEVARGLPRTIDAQVPVLGATLSQDGVLLAAACADGTVRIFEMASGRAARRMEAHAAAATDVAFLGDSRTVASGGRDQTICVLDAATGKVIRHLRVRESGAPGAPPPGEAEASRDPARSEGLTVSRDGGLALSHASDGAVLIWPLLDPNVPLEPPADLAPIYKVIGLRVVSEGDARGTIAPVAP